MKAYLNLQKATLILHCIALLCLKLENKYLRSHNRFEAILTVQRIQDYEL